MADFVAVIEFALRALFVFPFGSVGLLSVEAATSLTPLNSDGEATHVLSVQLLNSLLGISVRIILDKGVRSLLFDCAFTVFVEGVLKLVLLHVLRNVSNE